MYYIVVDAVTSCLVIIVSVLIIILIGLIIRRKRMKQRAELNGINFPWGLIVFVIIVILFSICTHCCREETRRPVYTPVVVTSATHTAPGGYPTSVQTVPIYPANYSGATYQQAVYPQQTPYPVSGAPSSMPMPMPQTQMQPNPIGMNQHVMPPYPTAGPGMNPPSYDSAVGHNPNPNAAAYEKQAPYNPSYSTGY